MTRQGELRGYDPDLLDYIFWAAQVRGLSPNTTRVRLDFLHRLHQFAGVSLREIEPHILLKFERVAIAGKAAETRSAYTSHLRAFFRWAAKTGIVSVDPTEVLTMP
ncbi:MAG TPA: phage integrase SAM-like domain-containing protein, partial [Solirubrobacteraceae bacterium]|nr:phage integrase SAM-like domain-containing protein [Solirubrobacteraceae bacterium]